MSPYLKALKKHVDHSVQIKSQLDFVVSVVKRLSEEGAAGVESVQKVHLVSHNFSLFLNKKKKTSHELLSHQPPRSYQVSIPLEFCLQLNYWLQQCIWSTEAYEDA